MPHNTIRRFDSTGEAYDACQTGEAEKGDLLWIPSEGVVGFADTWPFAVTRQHGALHVANDSAGTYMPDCTAAAVELAQALGLAVMAHLLPIPTFPEDDWVPACGGTEVPFVVKGQRLHYMWNRKTGQHAYYHCDRDVFLLPHEAAAILNV